MRIRDALGLAAVLGLAVPGIAAGAAFAGKPTIEKIHISKHAKKMTVEVTVDHTALSPSAIRKGIRHHAVVDVDIDGELRPGAGATAAQADPPPAPPPPGPPVPPGCEAQGDRIAPGVFVVCDEDASGAVLNAFPCTVSSYDVGVISYTCTLPDGQAFSLAVSFVGQDDLTAVTATDVGNGVVTHKVDVPWDYVPFYRAVAASAHPATLRKVAGTVIVHEIAIGRDGRIRGHVTQRKRFARPTRP